MDDKAALRALARGDEEALGWIIDKYSAYVGTVAWNVLCDSLGSAEAEEAAADTFLALWHSGGDVKPSKLKSWLGAVARNRALSRLRSARSGLSLEEDILVFSDETPAEKLERQELHRAVQTAVLIVALLATGAFASGVVSRIFAGVDSLNPFEEMQGIFTGNRDEILANTDTVAQLVSVDGFTKGATYLNTGYTGDHAGPVLSGFDFSLLENYYDGEKLMLGYKVTLHEQNIDRSFGPGSENFDKLISCQDGDYYLCVDELVMDMDEALYAELRREFREKGSAGVAVQMLYVGDHVRLSDGSDEYYYWGPVAEELVEFTVDNINS